MYQNVSRLSPNANLALNRQVDYSNSGGEDRKVYKQFANIDSYNNDNKSEENRNNVPKITTKRYCWQ